VAAVGLEAGGAALFHQQHRQLACRPAPRHRSSPEGGGVFFGRSASEPMPDDPQQFRLPVGETAQVALQKFLLGLPSTRRCRPFTNASSVVWLTKRYGCAKHGRQLIVTPQHVQRNRRTENAIGLPADPVL
jgi:hypothetical protein